MPPANSPTATPPGGSNVTASSPYLDQLAQLASPVPDLAATLNTSITPEQEVNDENVSFLRTRLPTPPAESDETTAASIAPGRIRRAQMPDSNTLPPLRNARTGQVISRTDSPSRLRRSIAAQQATAQDGNDEATWSTGGFGQSHPSYTGWAPGSSDDEEEPYPPLSENTQSSAQVYNEWSSRMRELRAARSSRADLSQLLEQVIETQNELDAYMRPTRETRQALEASARSGSHLPLPQYLLDRERNSREGEDQERRRGQRNHDRATMILEQRRRQQLLAEMQQRASRNESHRHRHTGMPVAGGILKPLEDTIKYLGSIRTCNDGDEQIETAKDAGLLRHEYVREWSDFLFDPRCIQPPPESSWLKPGGNFAGTQRAAGAACLHLPHIAGGPRVETGSRRRIRAERLYQEEFERARVFALSQSQDPLPNPRGHPTQSLHGPIPSDRMHEAEEWPVKVSIHGIDYSNMTLTGTMEASNVPDKSSPSHESSITTYLEGEVIDFSHHTLETKTYNANARIDGTYWRKLEPFKQFTDEQMVKNLLSRSWVNEVLMQNWILMRWKEKCFVKPSDAQSSLTISGFYYVSLRRHDGHIEGLYYDPSSTPYQYLSLAAEGKRTFPTYSFT